HRGDVGRSRQRRRAQTLEDAELATHDELDREAGERGVRAAVAEQPCEQRPRRGHAVDVAAVDRAEQQEEQQRKEEDEERRLRAAPEDELLVAQLVEEQPHSVSSTSAR